MKINKELLSSLVDYMRKIKSYVDIRQVMIFPQYISRHLLNKFQREMTPFLVVGAIDAFQPKSE